MSNCKILHDLLIYTGSYQSVWVHYVSRYHFRYCILNRRGWCRELLLNFDWKWTSLNTLRPQKHSRNTSAVKTKSDLWHLAM